MRKIFLVFSLFWGVPFLSPPPFLQGQEWIKPLKQSRKEETKISPTKELQRFQFDRPLMGMKFTVIFYAGDQAVANKAAEEAFARIARLNTLLSDYAPESELSKLSQTSGQGKIVGLSPELAFVLEKGQKLSSETDGAFDVTVGPYVRLWRRSRRQKEMPSAERLAEARSAVGYKHLRLDPKSKTAQLMVPGMRLDLGGIAAGYACDEALKILKQHGFNRALVDASGDTVVGDPPPGATGWRIGVAPLKEGEDAQPSHYLLLSNTSVTTSGDAFQYVEIDGTRYSHIVDPRTGLGLTVSSSVTVIAPDGITADSMATAVSVLGVEQGMKLVEQTPGCAALFVLLEDGQPKTYASKRWSEYLTPGK